MQLELLYRPFKKPLPRFDQPAAFYEMTKSLVSPPAGYFSAIMPAQQRGNHSGSGWA
jgi:hypothetical protein